MGGGPAGISTCSVLSADQSLIGADVLLKKKCEFLSISYLGESVYLFKYSSRLMDISACKPVVERAKCLSTKHKLKRQNIYANRTPTCLRFDLPFPIHSAAGFFQLIPLLLYFDNQILLCSLDWWHLAKKDLPGINFFFFSQETQTPLNIMYLFISILLHLFIDILSPVAFSVWISADNLLWSLMMLFWCSNARPETFPSNKTYTHGHARTRIQ